MRRFLIFMGEEYSDTQWCDDLSKKEVVKDVAIFVHKCVYLAAWKVSLPHWFLSYQIFTILCMNQCFGGQVSENYGSNIVICIICVGYIPLQKISLSNHNLLSLRKSGPSQKFTPDRGPHFVKGVRNFVVFNTYLGFQLNMSLNNLVLLHCSIR